MGCLLHPRAANIPAVKGNDLWFCGFPGCGTPIKTKDIKGGEKHSRLSAMDRWRKALKPRHKTKEDPPTPQPRKKVRGESQKQDDYTIRGKKKNRKKRTN